MKILIDNIVCTCIIGGSDNLKLNVYDALRSYLRVRPKDYSQMLFQMRKRGVKGWDGYTYFINKKAQFPTGFLPMVMEFLKDSGVSVVVEDKRQNVPKFKATLDFKAPQFTLAEHQQELIKKTANYISSFDSSNSWNIYFPRGVWKAATNAGKTAAAGNLIRSVIDARAIMLVDDKGLLMQHYTYYKTVFPGKGEVGFITSNKQRLGSVLTICMVKTLYRRLKASVTMQRDLHNKFNILLVDECHYFSSREEVYVINHINAGMRIAMSGTPFDNSDSVAKFRLIGMFGNTLHEVTKKYLMDKGYSLKPLIHIYLNPAVSKAMNYGQESAQVITQSDDRAELIADIICKYRKRKVMITFFDIKHGELMYDTFIERYPTLAYLADVVHGTSIGRADKIQDYIDNKTRILFASTIMQQGYNIPDIEVIIYAIGGKEAIALSQFGGRGERVFEDRTHFIWVDIFDQGHYVSKHSRKRLALYKKEDYPDPITFMYPNRKGNPNNNKVTL